MREVKSLELRVKSYARSYFATDYYLFSERSEPKTKLLTLNSKLLTSRNGNQLITIQLKDKK